MTLVDDLVIDGVMINSVNCNILSVLGVGKCTNEEVIDYVLEHEEDVSRVNVIQEVKYLVGNKLVEVSLEDIENSKYVYYSLTSKGKEFLKRI